MSRRVSEDYWCSHILGQVEIILVRVSEARKTTSMTMGR